MRRRLMSLVLAGLMLLAFTSCTQRIIPIPFPGHDNDGSKRLSSVELMRAADMDKIYSDAASVVAGSDVSGMDLVSITESSSGASLLRARSIAKSYDAVIRFTDSYKSGDVIISTGEMVFTFSGDYDDSTKKATVSSYTATTTKALVFEVSGISYDVNIVVNEPTSATLTITESSGSIEVEGSAEITTPAKGSDSITVDNNTPISSDDIGKSDSRFAGGYGTKNEPYKINNKTQFLNISELVSENPEAYNYFILTNDIDISYDDELDMFAGELDGDGHSINVTGPITYTNNQVPVENQTIRAFAGSARFYDFEYHTIGTKLFALGDITTQGGKTVIPESISFENVDAYGDLVASNNIAPYLVYIQATEVSFTNCTNYASMTGGAKNYCSPFAGYVVGYKDKITAPDLKRLTYTNCVNKGNFSMESVSFVIANGGNDGNYVRFWSTSDNPDENKIVLTINGCRNDGQMIGTLNANWFVWSTADQEKTSWDALNQYAEKNISGNAPRVVKLDGLKLSADKDESGNVSLSVTYPSADPEGNIYEYRYQKSYYGRFYYDAEYNDFAGTQLTIRKIEDPSNAGSAKVEADDLDMLIVNDKETYLEQPTGNWTYSVSVYDTDDALLGTASCSVSN